MGKQKIDSPSTPKSAFRVSALIFGVGSESLVLGVGSELIFGVRSELLTLADGYVELGSNWGVCQHT